MDRLCLWVVAAAVVLGGCQPKVVSPLMPLPLPIEPAPSTKLTVVGTGDTLEEAREAAIHLMVRQVILPATEPESAPTAEFVASMIRGYNVAGVAQDFLGKYYVTVELTISQLGINYQELYHQGELSRKEADLLRQDVQNEQKLREVAERREAAARKSLEEQRKAFEARLLELQAQVDALKQAPPGR